MAEPDISSQSLPAMYLFSTEEIREIKVLLENPLLLAYISTVAGQKILQVFKEKSFRPGKAGVKDSEDIRSDFGYIHGVNDLFSTLISRELLDV